MRCINKYLLTGLFTCLLLSGCSDQTVQGNGTLTDHNTPLNAIQTIKISGHFRINIIQNAKANLLVRTDENLQALLHVKQQGSSLTIESNPIVKASATPELTLTLNTLEQLEINGDNNATLENIKTPNFDLTLNGHQRVHLTGKTLNFHLITSGDNTLESKNFNAKNVTIKANGHNNLVVNCLDGDLSIKANGANQILYVGQPLHIQQDINGSTTVKTI